MRVSARFDDLRTGAGRSLRFGSPIRELQTGDLDQVVDVIGAADAARTAGLWVAGFVAYEAAPAFDDALAVGPPDADLPLVWFGVHERPLPGVDWAADGAYDLGSWEPDVDADAHAEAIAEIHRHIIQGDTYQTNYTFRLNGLAVGDLDAMYRDLAHAQSGGYGAMVATDSHVVLSASPELFFRWDEPRIETRPMKGTARRGRWSAEDAALRAGLLSSEKNRAENLMIVDLLRNDLGRVCEFGSIAVEHLFTPEAYPTIWTLTSTIAGRTRSDTSLVDVFQAMFPCGSVTGAPKARTMELIATTETAPRGVYCGSIGVLAPDGSGHPRAEFNVAIRTVVVDRATRAAVYGTGGGIVADSVAADERGEALLKARVLTDRRPIVGLIETMLWRPGAGVWLLHRHLERLRASAAYFNIPYPAEHIGAAIGLVAGAGPTKVRIVLDPDGSASIESAPIEPDGRPILTVSVDDEPVDPTDVTLFHKTTHRVVYERAAARHRDVDDVILVAPDGLATETTIGNLAVRFGDEWITPRVESGLLPGTYRQHLLDAGRLVEGDVPVERLAEAAELAVVNSVRGWRTAVLA